MSVLSDVLDLVFRRSMKGPVSAFPDSRELPQLMEELLSSKGEITGLMTAKRILDGYAAMNDEAKREFFTVLADRLDINHAELGKSLDAFRIKPDRGTYDAFLKAAEPRRQELARRLNRVPGATPQLVDMRADLLRLVDPDSATFRIDCDFSHLFASWFNRGFLVLRRISWESPAHILEKIIRYEAVHAISSWDELRRRVEPEDRRCFAFFHPAMPDEPLIFVEVALTKGIARSIQSLLSDQRQPLPAHRADTAMFYSISNCQAGLAGISFGNSLIKQVVNDLTAELPGLSTFSTLSPIPLFCRWLQAQGLEPDRLSEGQLTAAAAHYLTAARRPDGHHYDPVARFHLGNGALVHAVNVGADLSRRGMKESAGVMTNYLYDLSRLEQNHESFANQRQVAAAPQVHGLAQSFQSVEVLRDA
ncbi:malonyl-CoA decarboxylase [Rhizobium sp. RU36D]|uniref:malonyl-CoA decarboxylase domain-containing protein n=1 Tax=Rhizobium sp. RU36D TaxID=1907415 RepID=UPI0009D7C901|nr:malonyl-CoA decarboxylase [Rhizobium sp. RU36D]SMC72101.1 malonyl-CoA decarboxylase [Rhizobium sp. RU36D]